MSGTLINTLGADRRRALENVREAAARIWSRPLHRYYTDHTVAHSERVIALLDSLTVGMMVTDKRLSPTEVFCLLTAAYLHDIGMQNEKFAGGDLDEIRAYHNEQTAEMIYAVFEDPAHAFAIPLARDPGLVEAVALVAKGHRQVDLHAAEYEPFVHGGETVRLRLLAALLRFGDELDMDHRRVDLEQMKLLALPVESQLHWWKCHYVSGVSIVDEYIKVAYRFPQGRPDYEGLIVPLVEGEVRAKHAALEEVFRAHAVKVALGPSQVRQMRLVEPLPPEVEALARQRVEIEGGEARHSVAQPPSAGVKQVQLIIEGDFEAFDQQRLVSALAALLGVEGRHIRVLSVYAGSIIVTLEMPIVMANRLRNLAERPDFGLTSLGIVSVKLEGEFAISLIGSVKRVKEVQPSAPATSSSATSGATYNIHIESATGIAIGDQARVESPSGDRPPPGREVAQEDTFAPEDERATLQRELAQHKRNLYKLREQAALYAAGETPLHLLNQIEAEEEEIRRIGAELGGMGG